MERYIETKIILAEAMNKVQAAMMGLVRDADVTVEPERQSHFVGTTDA